jgi:hypothetical protein
MVGLFLPNVRDSAASAEQFRRGNAFFRLVQGGRTSERAKAAVAGSNRDDRILVFRSGKDKKTAFHSA